MMTEELQPQSVIEPGDGINQQQNNLNRPETEEQEQVAETDGLEPVDLESNEGASERTTSTTLTTITTSKYATLDPSLLKQVNGHGAQAYRQHATSVSQPRAAPKQNVKTTQTTPKASTFATLDPNLLKQVNSHGAQAYRQHADGMGPNNSSAKDGQEQDDVETGEVEMAATNNNNTAPQTIQTASKFATLDPTLLKKVNCHGAQAYRNQADRVSQPRTDSQKQNVTKASQVAPDATQTSSKFATFDPNLIKQGNGSQLYRQNF